MVAKTRLGPMAIKLVAESVFLTEADRKVPWEFQSPVSYNCTFYKRLLWSVPQYFLVTLITTLLQIGCWVL